MSSAKNGFIVKPLNDATWPDFARLVVRHNGIWGGCWCMGFHPKGDGWGKSAAQNRTEKELLVHNGQAHAALVYDADICVGWCQFGSPAELPRIKSLHAYTKDLMVLPDWRITCFFVDKAHRGKGVAAAGLAGALLEIARSGGGRVEAYPEDVEGRTIASAFLHTATLSLFARNGFEPTRRIGKNRWVVTKAVASSP